MEIKRRVMLSVSLLMENPAILDKDLVAAAMAGFGGAIAPVSHAQAYRDLGMVLRLVGNIKLASKEWYRHTVVQMCKEAYAIAREKGDAGAMASAADKIGKYTRADKEDETLDRESLIHIPTFEPSDDVTLLEGITPIENLESERRSFRALFKGSAQVVAFKETTQPEAEEEEQL